MMKKMHLIRFSEPVLRPNTKAQVCIWLEPVVTLLSELWRRR